MSTLPNGYNVSVCFNNLQRVSASGHGGRFNQFVEEL